MKRYDQRANTRRAGATVAEREADYTRQHGRAVGLTEPEINEVMAAWSDWYQAGGELDWSQVRSSMINRGIGIEWRPGVSRGRLRLRL